MNQTSGIIFNIQKFSINDGPGIRTTVFFKGCPLDCHWCHNPESKNREPERLPAQLYKRYNSCNKNGFVGYEVSVPYVMKEIMKDYIFYEESNGGVTFSGGEPLMQAEFLLELLKECKKKDINTAVDTSGFAPYEQFKKILNYTDLFLYDLKIAGETEHVKYTGISNKIIHENLRNLSLEGKDINIRIPLIPGITDTVKNLNGIIDLISGFRNIKHVTLLPYNEIGVSKYQKLNLEFDLNGLQTQPEDKLNEFCSLFKVKGFEVKIRG